MTSFCYILSITTTFSSINECVTEVTALLLLRHASEITSWGKVHMEVLFKAVLHVPFSQLLFASCPSYPQ